VLILRLTSPMRDAPRDARHDLLRADLLPRPNGKPLIRKPHNTAHTQDWYNLSPTPWWPIHFSTNAVDHHPPQILMTDPSNRPENEPFAAAPVDTPNPPVVHPMPTGAELRDRHPAELLPTVDGFARSSTR